MVQKTEELLRRYGEDPALAKSNLGCFSIVHDSALKLRMSCKWFRALNFAATVNFRGDQP